MDFNFIFIILIKMKLAKYFIYAIAVLSVLLNFCEAKVPNENEPSYNPLPRSWRSAARTNSGTRSYHGTKFRDAQSRMYVQNSYKDTSRQYRQKLAKRHKVIKKALRKIN